MDVKNVLFSAILCVLIKYKTVVSSRSYLLSTQLCYVRTGLSGIVCLKATLPFSINKYSLFALKVDFLFASGYKAKEHKFLWETLQKLHVSQNLTMLAFLFFYSQYMISLLSRERETWTCSDSCGAFLPFFFVARLLWMEIWCLLCISKVFSPAKLLTYFG